jgi:hypothetical protein
MIYYHSGGSLDDLVLILPISISAAALETSAIRSSLTYNSRVMIKKVLIFLEGIVCKHLLAWGLLLSIYFHFLKYIPEK